MRVFLRPSVIAATTFKNLLIVHLKATIHKKNHIHYAMQAADLYKKPVASRRPLEKSRFVNFYQPLL
jgi:hypothetical protein